MNSEVQVALEVAVETILSIGPPPRSRRAELSHRAPTLGAWRKSIRWDRDDVLWVKESIA